MKIQQLNKILYIIRKMGGGVLKQLVDIKLAERVEYPDMDGMNDFKEYTYFIVHCELTDTDPDENPLFVYIKEKDGSWSLIERDIFFFTEDYPTYDDFYHGMGLFIGWKHLGLPGQRNNVDEPDLDSEETKKIAEEIKNHPKVRLQMLY
jgi:hypothetical protein